MSATEETIALNHRKRAALQQINKTIGNLVKLRALVEALHPDDPVVSGNIIDRIAIEIDPYKPDYFARHFDPEVQ